MDLPEKRAIAQRIWINQKFLMIGKGGIGKSDFWSHGDKTLFIDTEGNLEHLEVMKVACRCWEDFLEVGSSLVQANNAGKLPYDTVVIDTGDKWIDYADEFVIQMASTKYAKAIEKGLEINTIGDIPEGNGWFLRKNLIGNYLGKLTSLPCAVVLVCHVMTREVKDPVKKYDRSSVSIGGQLGDSLCYWANHIMNVQGVWSGQTLARTVYTLPSQSREAKSHGAIIPNGWVWTNDMAENYGKLRNLFQ